MSAVRSNEVTKFSDTENSSTWKAEISMKKNRVEVGVIF